MANLAARIRNFAPENAWHTLCPAQTEKATLVMRILIIACLALLAVGCQTSRTSVNPIAYQGGDGSSYEQAILIREAHCREAGILAQRLWLERTYPGYRAAKESTQTLANRQYAVFEIATAEGQTRTVYFDTTEFANK